MEFKLQLLNRTVYGAKKNLYNIVLYILTMYRTVPWHEILPSGDWDTQNEF